MRTPKKVATTTGTLAGNIPTGCIPLSVEAENISAIEVTSSGSYPNSIFIDDLSMAATSLSVNGYKLSTNQERWVRYIAGKVIPQLLGATRNERIQTASISTWWALKEGVLSLKDPLTYSSCSQTKKNGTYKDVRLDSLETCDPGSPWQVGISGIQVPNFSESDIALIWDTDTILSEVVEIAGFDQNSEPGISIINSSGDLRKSWLLRHPVVGITLQEDVVYNECVVSQLSWCYGRTWPETKLFAPTMEDAQRSIDDLINIYNVLAP